MFYILILTVFFVAVDASSGFYRKDASWRVLHVEQEMLILPEPLIPSPVFMEVHVMSRHCDSTCEDLIPLSGYQFSASSYYNDDHLPKRARKLDAPEAWCHSSSDAENYLQIKFKKLTRVVKLTTQGLHKSDEYSKQYRLMFSQDGTSFGNILSSGGSTMYYTGNYDRDSKVTNYLAYPVLMRYLRIHVTEFHKYACLRVAVYGCDALTSKGCDSYQLPNVTNDKLTSSSFFSSSYDLTHSRLNSDNAWCPLSSSGEVYVQVEFRQMTNVIGIVTKGRTDYNSFVKTYHVKFSQDGSYWQYVLRDNGNTMVFRGNWDMNTKMESMFDHVVPVKYLRIYPEYYEDRQCLRFDVIGCVAPSVMSCGDYLVSGVDPIADNMITASSYYTDSHVPYYGRITTSQYWCANSDSTDEYFQVHFRTTINVAGFMHKGPSDYESYVVLYSISYSDDGGKTWTYVKQDNGKIRIFFGNRDKYSMMLNMLDTPIEADMIRFNTKYTNNRPCGSFEVLGCYSVPEVRTGFYGQFVPMKVDSSILPFSLWKKTSDILTCIQDCSKDNECMSFTYHRNREICNGYSAMFYKDDQEKPQASEHMYYIDRSFLDGYGYTLSEAAVLWYKIFTQAVSHTAAEEKCKEQKTNLLPIKTAAHLKEIQKILEKGKDVIKNGLHVGGKYDSTKVAWLLHDNTYVDDSLWSTSGKNSDNGHCIVLNKTGLTSADCNSKVFFACGL